MKKAYAKTRGGRVHYVTAGSGDPLLLLHMTPRSWKQYSRVIPALAEKRLVIAMDTLGFGNSDDPPNGYAILDYAGAALDLLNHLEIDSIDVWGMLTGASIGVALAINWPHRVRRLILMAAPLFANDAESNRRIDEAREKRSWAPREDGSHLLDIWRYATGESALSGQPEQGEQPTRSTHQGDGWSRDEWDSVNDFVLDAVRAGDFSRASIALYNYDLAPKLPIIGQPTLVIGLTGWQLSWYVRAENRFEQVQRLIPNSELLMLDGQYADMRVTYVRHAELTRAVEDFLGRAES